MAGSSKNSHGKVCSNRKAFRDYSIIQRFEAGVELRGTEVKSVKAGLVSLTGAFARVEGGEVILHSMTVQPYEQGNRFNHDPVRPRRLLLHKKEINALERDAEQKGFSIIPLSVYMKGALVKIELGLCRGRSRGDKRENMKRKTAEREAERAMARRR